MLDQWIIGGIESTVPFRDIVIGIPRRPRCIYPVILITFCDAFLHDLYVYLYYSISKALSHIFSGLPRSVFSRSPDGATYRLFRGVALRNMYKAKYCTCRMSSQFAHVFQLPNHL